MLIGRAPGIAARLRSAKTLVLSTLLVFGLPVQAADAPTADDVRAVLDSGSALRVDGQPLRAEVLREFYASVEFEPVWGTDPAASRARRWRSTRSAERETTASCRRTMGWPRCAASRSRRPSRWPSSASFS